MSLVVSINCITYNQEQYIGDAIEGFLMQETDFEYEILIGEDCSTDRTREIVDQYVKKYPHQIRLITSDVNVGARMNSQRLIDESKGKYIAECEGDDYWIDPYKLQKQVDYMEANSDCSFCFHNAHIINANKKNKRKPKCLLLPQQIKLYANEKGNFSAGKLAVLGFIPTASFFYPKHLMVPPPDWYFRAIVGDNAIKLITTSHGYAHYIDQVMSVYRVNVKGSVMDKWRKEKSNTAKKVAVAEGFIHLFDDFDAHTNYQYKDEIELAKVPFELNIIRLNGSNKDLNHPRYRAYLKNMQRIEKLNYFMGLYFPKLHATLARFKAHL